MTIVRADQLGCLTLFLTSLLFVNCAEGRPLITTRGLPSWLEDLIPKRGATIADEIKCYSLPYGGIGFLSHVLTYWTVFWLCRGRKPWWPISRLSHSVLDLTLSGLQILITISVAAFTIARCRSRWQFILLAVWKLIMSLVVGVCGLSAALQARKDSQDATRPGRSATEKSSKTSRKTKYSLLFYYPPGMIIGLVGLLSLVSEHISNPGIWKVTAVFGSVVAAAGVLALAMLLIGSKGEVDSRWGRSAMAIATPVLLVMPTLMMFLGALYADWILGIFAGNLVGVPDSTAATLYWVSESLFPHPPADEFIVPCANKPRDMPDLFCRQTAPDAVQLKG